MDLTQVFERTSYQWMRYDEYEWKTAKNGELYLTPTANAQPTPYTPLECSQEIVLDALNVGKVCVGKRPVQEKQAAIAHFASQYGLLGFITALPTTPHFMEYEAVYLPKNHFIKKETLSTEDYLALFFPFDELDVVKHGVESTWNISDARCIFRRESPTCTGK